jgi:hypothetical protein
MLAFVVGERRADMGIADYAMHGFGPDALSPALCQYNQG